MSISARVQTAVLWWAIGFMVIWSLAFFFLMHMVPPPPATDSAEQVAHWYQSQATSIRIGATISGLTSAFMLPFWAVVACQIWRQEKGAPILTILAATAGTMMTLFITFSPIFWGVAAFAPHRAPEITAAIHQLGVLSFVTTDQFSPFCWVAVGVVCFIPQAAPHSPFPRWMGYLSIWTALILEPGAVAFNFNKGPLAWNGLLVYWSPLIFFGVWLVVLCPLLFKNLKLQRMDAEAAAVSGDAVVNEA